MVCYENFVELFGIDPEVSFDEQTILEICSNRKSLQCLFIERIMNLLEIKNSSSIYPPKSNTDLRNLHKTVIQTKGLCYLKLSVFYYVLLELDNMTKNSDFSQVLEKKSYLPKKYLTLVRGLWYMDRLQFELALQYLTHPSLIPSFSDEIIEVLSKASINDPTLTLAYYHSIQPPLNSIQALDFVFSALANTNITEAFHFSRTRNEYCHRHMFELLILIVLKNSHGDQAADNHIELVNLPFTHQEDSWFEDYLKNGEGKMLEGGGGMLMMRYIGTGQFSKFISLQESDNNKNINGLDWAIISTAVRTGLGPRLAVQTK